MKRTGTSLMIGTVLAFIASLLLHGLMALRAVPPLDAETDAAALMAAEQPVDMIRILLVPQSLAAASLMAMLCLALAYHALRRWQGEDGAADRGFGRNPAEAGLARHAPLILGASAGVVWPWLLPGHVLAATLLSGVTLAGFLAAALAGLRQGGRSRNSAALCFAAGWATLAAMAMLSALLKRELGAPALLAAAVGLGLAALITASVQLRLGRSISYSVAVIWGLIAIAAGAMLANVGLATLAVLAIAVIAVVLVQVST